MTKLLFVFDGAYAYSPKRFKAYKENYLNLKNIPDSTIKIIEKERIKVSYTPLLDLVYTSHYPKDFEIHYSAQTSIKSSIRFLSNCDLKDYTIDIIGYSWGGDAAMRFIRYLKNQKINVNKVFTLDPIRRGPIFLGFTRSINGNINYFKKELNVSKHFNIYQKTDRYSLPLIHLRGNKVLGADYNLNLSKKYKDASHVNLHLFEEVKAFLNL